MGLKHLMKYLQSKVIFKNASDILRISQTLLPAFIKGFLIFLAPYTLLFHF